MSQSQSQSSRPSTPASARYVPPIAPTLDRSRADEIIKLSESDLLYLRLDALKLLQAEVERLSREASGLLTFELTRREKEVADGETYGALIAVGLSFGTELGD